MFERLFKLSERKTSAGTELVAGRERELRPVVYVVSGLMLVDYVVIQLVG